MAGHVVADAGPLIHLTQADGLHLLVAFDEVSIPQTVLDEARGGGVSEALDTIDHTVRAVDYATDDFPTLDPGESAAITVCLDSDAILLTDDLAAREVATNLGIEVHGSIGVVLYGYAHDHLDDSEAKMLIRSLKRDTTLYLADPLVEYALRVIEADYDGWQ